MNGSTTLLRRSTITPLLLSFLMIAVSGCAAKDNSASLPSSAVTEPISVSTEVAVASATPTVSPTAAPTDTPTPEKVVLTFTKNAFCRKGPSTRYFDIGSFDQGASAQADGRNDTDPRWWYMLMSSGEHCWVSDSTVLPNPAAEALPVRLPEKALPQTPQDLWADRICKKGGFAVTLNWTPSSNADGYYIYLNGEMIQEIKRELQTSYVVKPPLDQPVSYGLEAYNSIGTGEPIMLEDPGCP